MPWSSARVVWCGSVTWADMVSVLLWRDPRRYSIEHVFGLFRGLTVTGPVRRGEPDPELVGLSQADQLAVLRGRMARVDGRVGAVARADVRSTDVFAVPGALGGVLPAGGLVRGSSVRCGRGSVLTGLLAAVTGSGRSAAVVGGATLGLLAAYEMGARLDRLFLVDPGRRDVGEVASILIDGLDVVVLDVDDIVVAPSRWKVLAARARASGGVLVVSGRGARTPGVGLDVASHPIGYDGLSGGRGRVKAVHLAVTVSERAGPRRRSRLTVAGVGDGRLRWLPYSAARSPESSLSRAG